MSKFRNKAKGTEVFINNEHEISNGNKLISKTNHLNSILEGIYFYILKMFLNKNTLEFINKQDKNMLKYLKFDVLIHKNEFNRYGKDKLYDNFLILENLEEVKIFKAALKSSFYDQADDFIYVFRCGKSYNDILNVIDFFIKNNVGSDIRFNSYVIDCSMLESFLRNDFIKSFSEEDKLKIIKNNYMLDCNYDFLDFENLNIMKDDNSIYLYKVNQENLSLINKIESIMSLNGKDKGDYFYGFGILDYRLTKTLYKLRKEIIVYIDIISNMYEESLKQFNLISSLLIAIQIGAINDYDSMSLIISKAECGHNLERVDDILLHLFDINVDVYDEFNISIAN